MERRSEKSIGLDETTFNTLKSLEDSMTRGLKWLLMLKMKELTTDFSV